MPKSIRRPLGTKDENISSGSHVPRNEMTIKCNTIGPCSKLALSTTVQLAYFKPDTFKKFAGFYFMSKIFVLSVGVCWRRDD